MKPPEQHGTPSAAATVQARIAVDATGGDAPLRQRVSGARRGARRYPDVHVLLCGPAPQLEQTLEGLGGRPDNLSVVDAPDAIEMHEAPVQALRSKPNSSIAVGVGLVADGEADAFVSAGNTGAVAAAGTLELGRPEGILRPGIAAPMKVIEYPVVTIDVGANVDCKPEHLCQYGIMASVFAREVLGIEDPRVGLLNIGEESTKGNELTKKAYQLLGSAQLNFVGNIEPEQFFHHECDVLVCDGFAGNILLKFGEGLVMRLIEWFREQVAGSLRYKLGLGMCKDLFGHLRHCADYTEYGGAPLLGLNGVIIITHGSSDARAIENTVREARSFVEHHVGEHIRRAVLADTAARSAPA